MEGPRQQPIQRNRIEEVDTETEKGPEEKIRDIHQEIESALAAQGIPQEKIARGEVRPQSILYMTYWFHRLQNNPEERSRIRENLVEYIGATAADPSSVADALFSNDSIRDSAKEYVETLLQPTKTIDLVITKDGPNGEKEILCSKREYYPLGSALPGGIIKDEDEDNALGLPAHEFAALRVAGEKVLGLIGDKVRYERTTDDNGKESFLIRGEQEFPVVRLHAEDEGGYRYHENVKTVLRPSDPRHIVDTIGFKCEIEGDPANTLVWKNKSEIMSPDSPTGGFAFGHHREIVAFITAQTSIEKERQMKEREFIRSIIKNPLESYHSLKERFDAAGNSPETSFKELFPMVDRVLADMFSEDINELCREVPILAGIRDKAVISLRQVCLKNRTFCPYLPTLNAIAQGIAFFDLAERQKRGFYDTMPKDTIVEHDPSTTPHASYHMYRYKYRLDQLMNKVPRQIVIRTFESLSATDLLRTRCVPVRFIGSSRFFQYVDEFEQSPEEFDAHDGNHCWRMMMEDEAAMKELGLTQEELAERSSEFSGEYLDRIKIHATDTEEQKEMKKLKKIILFEIVHEDARPFLKEIICKYVQVKEGGPVPFEVPRIDQETGYMDVVDTLDTGISTLSYVRNKLQHGFYDQVDAQLPQIVAPKYRTAEWIARAAQDMLSELGATPESGTPLESDGRISYEWLLRRTCAAGPDNIHAAKEIDPALAAYGDNTEKLNPKRYQAK
jgi:hypothetical protein